MNKNHILSEYEAAAVIGISPKLLVYFTKHTVKKDDSRKLALVKNPSNKFQVMLSELLAYNEWLKAPWPSIDKKRPHLPNAIREEIREEANLECAFCKSSGEAGEAAHIRPVAESKSNHPHNLIWLCANHHVKFDNGSFGPKGGDNETIMSLKQALHHFKKMSWEGQASIIEQLAITMALCGQLNNQLSTSKSAAEINAIKTEATKLIEVIPKLASQSDVKQVRPTLDRLLAKLAYNTNRSEELIEDQLATVSSFEADFLKKSGLIVCPLCNGKTSHNEYDCPVCHGNGAIRKDQDVDLSEFQVVECPLCNGAGQRDGQTCPGCDGNGSLEARFADQIDPADFGNVECPVCAGSGRGRDSDCPACLGNGQLPKRTAESLDVRSYDSVDCPTCDGTGLLRGDTCPHCIGDGSVERRFADAYDRSALDLESCPLCKGSGQFRHEDCPACGGDGKLTAERIESLDLSQFDLVTCTVCRGAGQYRGDDCAICEGGGRVQRRFADRY